MNTKTSIFLCLTSLFLGASCTTEKKETKVSSIDQVLSQKYSINVDSNSLVKGKQGSSFLFPAGSLVDEQDSTVKGKVDIELMEINTIEDFIKSGITTQSDGKLLISDGSYYLNATQNGKKLHIKSGKQVYARFPTAVKDKEMKFFIGEKTADGDVNWKLEENQKPIPETLPAALSKRTTQKTAAKIKAEPAMKISEAEHTKLFAEYNDLSMYLYDNIYNDETKYVKLGEWYVPEDEADRIVRSKFGISYSEYRPFNNYNTTDNPRPDNTERIITDGDTKASPFRYRASIVEAREKRFKELNKMLGINQPKKPENFAKKQGIKKEENESWDSFIKREDEAYKKEFGTQSYLYALNKLGWVNCDKFYNELMGTYEGKILSATGEPIPYATEVHLVSRKNKIHLKQLVIDGTYKFKYPAQKAFDIIFVYGTEEVTKTFDGNNVLLEDIQLSIKQ